MYLWNIEKLLKLGEVSPYCGKLKSIDGIVRNAFTIKSDIGNNTFAYSKGKELYVAPLIYGTDNEILPGNKVAFADYQDGELLESFGLESYVIGWSGSSKTPIYLCDNHNMVLESWKLVAQYSPKLKLVHIDQHRDDAEYKGTIKNGLIETRICDYIDFALKAQWIDNEVISIIQSADLWKKQKIPKNTRCILNIDLDFFIEELTMISIDEKISMIHYFLPYAEIITMATSPCFIDQKLALRLGTLFWKYL